MSETRLPKELEQFGQFGGIIALTALLYWSNASTYLVAQGLGIIDTVLSSVLFAALIVVVCVAGWRLLELYDIA